VTGENIDDLIKEMVSDLNNMTRSWMKRFGSNLERYVGSRARVEDVLQGLLELLSRTGGGMIGPSCFMESSALDPYRILGLENSASDEEVKKRYRELIRMLHPDASKVKGTATLFQIVMGAYEAIGRQRGWK
jgi:DnaJ-domain-containing protein 1